MNVTYRTIVRTERGARRISSTLIKEKPRRSTRNKMLIPLTNVVLPLLKDIPPPLFTSNHAVNLLRETRPDISL